MNNVANACNTSNTVTYPPDWYTGASILKADGSKTTLKDQLIKQDKRDQLDKLDQLVLQNQLFNQ